jgi:hypothetical protein
MGVLAADTQRMILRMPVAVGAARVYAFVPLTVSSVIGLVRLQAPDAETASTFAPALISAVRAVMRSWRNPPSALSMAVVS